MEFNANSSFYKFNEQWGWFGWSDGPFLGDSLDYQEDLKTKHLAGITTSEVLTPYYNIGFDGVQPIRDPMIAATGNNEGYLLYGDYNAKNYLRRFSLHVKSLNYGQWERDPSISKKVEQHSDVYNFNTIGEKVREITSGGGGQQGTQLDGGTMELTLLDLNTQDLYYKEGPAYEQMWNYGAQWDPWPSTNRTYGFGQHGGQLIKYNEELDSAEYKRYASPVKGAPARIRRIPIYTKYVKYPDRKRFGGGLHKVEGRPIYIVPTAQDGRTDNPEDPVPVLDKDKEYWQKNFGISLDPKIIEKILRVPDVGSAECNGCEGGEKDKSGYKTGYYYTLSTAPVMAPNFEGTPNENGLGWDPGPGLTRDWSISNGQYGIMVESVDRDSCPHMIKDVRTKGYAGDTEIDGFGPCKELTLDMGLYDVRGNTESDFLYEKVIYFNKKKKQYEYRYDKIIDTTASNLWIGEPQYHCDFYEKGIRSGDCQPLENAVWVPPLYGKPGYWRHNISKKDFVEIYKLAESGFDPSCLLRNDNQFYQTSQTSAIENIDKDGAIKLNFREIRGLECIEVYKGEDIFPEDCQARNHLYISGGCGGQSITGTGCLSTYESGNTIYISGECPSITGDGSIFTYYDEFGVLHISGKAGESKNITGTGCISTYEIDDTIYIDSDVPNIKVNWGTGLGTGYGLLETGEGTISGSSNLIKGYYNITGSGACPTNFLEFYSITGTGCIDTFIEDNKIYISGGKGVTGATSPNLDPLDNVANVYSGIRTGECGDELVFKSLSGTECIQILDRGHYIEIENQQQFFANDSNLWHTGGGIYEEACYFNFELKDITGVGCISTYAEDNTIYISGENCLPEGGSSCDVLVGPSDNPSWKDSESLILECLGVSWKTITMCEEDGSTSCYDILVRPCSASTTTPSP